MAKNRIGFSSDFVLLNNRVGIGTTNPNATLDVNGDINISGIVTVTDWVALNAVGGASTQQIRVVPYTSDSGIISFEGDAGQLFSISNTNTGTLFAVNDTSGDTIISVNSDYTINAPTTGGITIASAGAATTQQIRIIPYTEQSGVISFEGDAGQLFSISNTNTGTLFAVNNTSGVPILSVVDTDGAVGLGTTAVGTVRVGLGTTSTPTVNSSMSFELTSNTNLRFKVRGTDGVLRSGNITLA